MSSPQRKSAKGGSVNNIVKPGQEEAPKVPIVVAQFNIPEDAAPICPEFPPAPAVSKLGVQGIALLACVGSKCAKYDWCVGAHSAKAREEKAQSRLRKMLEGLKGFAIGLPFGQGAKAADLLDGLIAAL